MQNRGGMGVKIGSLFCCCKNFWILEGNMEKECLSLSQNYKN